MASLTATSVGTAAQVVAETPTSGDVWALYRITPGGRALVRGFPVRDDAGWIVVYDTEAPAATPVSYELEDDGGTVVLTSGEVAVTASAAGWLRDPTNPSRDIEFAEDCPRLGSACDPVSGIFFQGFGDVGLATATGVFDLDGGVVPITVAQPRRGEAGIAVFVSLALPDITAMKTILADGVDLVLQLPVETGWGLTTSGLDYIAVGDVTMSRVSIDMFKPYRVWQLPYRVTNGPVEAPLSLLSVFPVGSTFLAPDGYGWEDTTGTWGAATGTWVEGQQ